MEKDSARWHLYSSGVSFRSVLSGFSANQPTARPSVVSPGVNAKRVLSEFRDIYDSRYRYGKQPVDVPHLSVRLLDDDLPAAVLTAHQRLELSDDRRVLHPIRQNLPPMLQIKDGLDPIQQNLSPHGLIGPRTKRKCFRIAIPALDASLRLLPHKVLRKDLPWCSIPVCKQDQTIRFFLSPVLFPVLRLLFQEIPLVSEGSLLLCVQRAELPKAVYLLWNLPAVSDMAVQAELAGLLNDRFPDLSVSKPAGTRHPVRQPGDHALFRALMNPLCQIFRWWCLLSD